MNAERMNQVIHEQILGLCSHNMLFAKAYGFEVGCPKCHVRYNHLYRIPDYTTDLNAVALAEAKVCEKGASKYGLHLTEIVLDGYACDWSDEAKVATANALQRSEACLRAMDLWEADDER